MAGKLYRPASVADVRVAGAFWHGYQELVRTQAIPYQWEALNDRVTDAEPSHCIHNFKVAAGVEEGEFRGEFFQDSDLYKWMEAAAWSLAWHPDPELEEKVDYVVDLIGRAQLDDGYVDTYYQVKAGIENRFTNLRSHHELYCMGHMIEAAIAYWKATGKRAFLDIATRFANCAYDNIGPEEGKIHGYPGHEIAEMALVALHEATGDPRHLELATYFVNQRGQSPVYFEVEQERYGNPFRWGDTYMGMMYYQAAKPIREQLEPEGHAVRDVYMYAGATEVACATDDDGLLDVCRSAFESMATRRMYVTGGIGSSEHGECFTFDYDLPNDTAYAETCASCGLAFWARRMFEATGDARYVDAMERALYNGAISGMSLDGSRFFYVNPLEVDPEACLKDYNKRHVKAERQKWFSCACCPPNLARTIESLGSYAYAAGDGRACVNLYVGGTAALELGCGRVSLEVETDYPWDGTVRVRVTEAPDAPFELALRLPGWCEEYALSLGGAPVEAALDRGMLVVSRRWEAGDELVLELSMPARLVQANPRVRDDAGKVCAMRGPLVYCAEEVDNGAHLQELRLDPTAPIRVVDEPGLLGGVAALECPGRRLSQDGWDGVLYRSWRPEEASAQDVRLVPYYAWGNRGLGEMSVWIGA